MSLSIEELSQPISEDLPSGENLEYDPQYLEMENLFQSRPESSLKGYDSDDGGPDWKGVGKLAANLSKRTRDLKVQVYAAVASLHTKELSDFRDNLELLKIYLDSFWDSVHPQLDPDDGNDPTQRLNILQMLNDHSLVEMALDRVKLAELKGVGRFTVRDVNLAQGKDSPEPDEVVPDIKLIRQAFATSEKEHLDKLLSAVSQSVELLTDMDRIWKEKADDKEGLGFDTTEKSLDKISAMLKEFNPVPSASESAKEHLTPGETAPAPAVSGGINNRSDVIRVLDRICDYYEVNEPSSPIPLLLRRAQRLVEKSFMEILEDMVPDGVQQAKLVSGSTDED